MQIKKDTTIKYKTDGGILLLNQMFPSVFGKFFEKFFMSVNQQGEHRRVPHAFIKKVA
jgi:hypothetical protein